jgi:hypothetical protein
MAAKKVVNAVARRLKAIQTIQTAFTVFKRLSKTNRKTIAI